MKAYVMTTGAVFGLITLAHSLAHFHGRAAPRDGAAIHSPHRRRSQFMSLGSAPALGLETVVTAAAWPHHQY